jgi:ubiquinone/menaquinone biosynthesis C-methylase UbiE
MEDWDNYWAKKQEVHTHAYDRIAIFYRKYIIKPYLRRYLGKYFNQQSRILHAGCGSGQVEEEIAGASFPVIGMDISQNALAVYRSCHTDPMLIRGDILSMGIKGESLDGLYNLGVMEHFSEEEIHTILLEYHRVLKSDGVAILFIPPEYGSTVIFFKVVHYVLNSVMKRDIYFQPPEPNRIKSKKWIERIVQSAGFELAETNFALNDFFTYMVVVLKKRT